MNCFQNYDFSYRERFLVLGSWGKLTSAEIDIDYGNFDLCHALEMSKSVNIEAQYCLATIDTGKSNVNKM